MKTRTVLLVGGPRDGHRVQVEEFTKMIDIPGNEHYQIDKLRGFGFEGYIATLGSDPRDPMQILFEEYGKAGA